MVMPRGNCQDRRTPNYILLEVACKDLQLQPLIIGPKIN